MVGLITWYFIKLIAFFGTMFILLAVYACCVVAGRADRAMEAYHNKKPPGRKY